MNKIVQQLKARKRFSMNVIAAFLVLIIPIMSGCEKKVENSFKSDIPDFSAISGVKERKEKFFAYIRPHVVEKNAEIIIKRTKLLSLYDKYLDKTELTLEEKNWLENLAREYILDRKGIDPNTRWILLMRRVDIIPVELALIQAAKESGWGASRFARMGYNMYGQRCFKKGCGIVPNDRAKDKVFEVVKFKSVRDSVRSYMHNLNISHAYHDLRTIRFALRENEQVPDGYSLIPGLPLYSERRDAYLGELRDMILENRQYMGS